MQPEARLPIANHSLKRRAQQDPWYVRWTLISLAVAVVGLLVIVPVVNVFYQALAGGLPAYWKHLTADPDTRHAMWLTLTVAPVAVVLNVVFGVAAAWAITRFDFPGRTVLTTIIDLPFAVSPVVAGLMLVLLFGRQGHFGPWLRDHGIQIIFAWPGLVLATTFVTLPFVARELIPLMAAIGSDEEVAAVSLGANGWQLFWRVTLPNIKWGLLFGVILCNARAMGEFGAVYVVSGHIAGKTDTMPLRVEKLFQEYNNPASFAVASVLTFLALVTLFLKIVLESKTQQEIADAVESESQGKRSMSVQVLNVTKRFGKFVALDNVTLTVPSGSLLALLGPSGSGKTTLLRIIAGLETSDAGTVLHQEEDVTDRAPRDRNVGFVFQHYALFRHMTVFENVAFGMRVRKMPRAQIAPRVKELLHLVRLENLERRYPSQLSGGQRQRVALARELAVQPQVLLLDEPFGALDAKVRQELRQWLRNLHEEIHVTTVFVTHDQEEAFEVADQVVVMQKGHIEQFGTPQEVFDHPATPFVMDFLGNVNVFHGRVESGKAMLGGMEVAYPEYPHAESRTATGYVRPHELEIERASEASEASNGKPSMRGRILQINPAGSVAKLRVLVEDFGVPLNIDVNMERYAELNLKTGDTVHVSPRKVRVFMPDDYSI